MLNKKIKILRVMRVASSGVASVFLAFLMYSLLFPPASSQAAETDTAKISVEVEPILEIALDATSVMLSAGGETEIMPTAAGVEATGDVNVYVSTNDTNGYSLSVYTQDATQNMTHSNENVTTAITPITAQGGTSTLSGNTWGFKVNNGSSWYAVGASENNMATVNDNGKATGYCDNFTTNYETCYSSNKAEKTTVTFGAKLTDTLPAGTYTNNVVFTVVAGVGAGEE